MWRGMPRVMDKFTILVVLVVSFEFGVSTTPSRARIINNGYEGVLIALPEVEKVERKKIAESLIDLLQISSSTLLGATKGRAAFRNITVLVPRSWDGDDKWKPISDSVTFDDSDGFPFGTDDADFIITNDSSIYPFTLHAGGCGRSSVRTVLPLKFLLQGEPQQKNIEFTRFWAELRYGVFPENGFSEDNIHPDTYRRVDEDVERSTGCTNHELGDFERSNGETIEQPFISLMDRHSKDGAAFCEGEAGLGLRHDPVAPTKQNLMCHEEATWFTVLRSPDFYNGINASPRNNLPSKVAINFQKESVAPRIVVVIDVSAKISQQNYLQIKNAFYHFVAVNLPTGSILDLFTFAGNKTNHVTSSYTLNNEESKITYLETQPLLDELENTQDACPDCALLSVFQMLKNESLSSGIIILITSEHFMSSENIQILKEDLRSSNILLHAFLVSSENSNFTRQESLKDLCQSASNDVTYLGKDVIGNLYRGLNSILPSHTKTVLIKQQYLIPLDEENIDLPFVIDSDSFDSLLVELSGADFGTSLPLEQEKTILLDSKKQVIVFKKKELIPAWHFEIQQPKQGEYVMKTRRKEGRTNPVLFSVTATSKQKEELITIKLWVENTHFHMLPAPVQIFAEIRQGLYPVVNATVTAHVYHPDGRGITELHLVDDGIGNVDVTYKDGIYSRYFTNFTGLGYYNVFVTAVGEFDDNAAVYKGPSSPCCGSVFPGVEETTSILFRREAGPETFFVDSLPQSDIYPPARVTDLTIVRTYDKLCSLRWTAVGNNIDDGVASAYELKLFEDRAAVWYSFENSEQEVWSENIETTPLAEYGNKLYHLVQLPDVPQSGVYFFAIRATDEAGNKGEPSNSVPIYIDAKLNAKGINCDADKTIIDKPTAEGYNSGFYTLFPYKSVVAVNIVLNILYFIFYL